ncbi:ABC transporter ATP-binding protein [Ferruginivarius sediminum]|uniref:ABC transporter ATP-binding protein n=1 Tax=Ferruginivarius sediminum TaxID=2661937 RepID=UPI001F4E7ABE|nr:ABC transporter ATP-binding protein [Ferruginivarius sediminum]
MNDLLVDVRDLSVRYTLSRSFADLLRRKPGRELAAVDGAHLAIRKGEAVGLVGESGSGKSSLGRALLRLTPATGEVRFDGTDVLRQDRRSLLAYRKRAQMVFQDPLASLNPRFKVGEALAEVLRVHRLTRREEIPGRVAALLDTVGLDTEFADRRPRGLSGGQCQRVGIARALAVEPEFIIADEPVSALDLSIQAQILNLFLRLQREMQLTMLFISHDLGVVHHLCQRVAVMYLGRIVEEGPADEIFYHPKHPYTQSLVEAMPRVEFPKGRRELPRLEGEPPSPADKPPGCAFHPRCPHVMDACRQDPPPSIRRVGAAATACHLYPETEKA